MTALLRRLLVLTTLAAMVAAAGVVAPPPSPLRGVAAAATSTVADVGAPSWWSGPCDNAHWDPAAAAQGWTGAGAHTLGASYLGVPVCGPRRSGDGAPDVQWTKPGWGHFEWECVELAMRFMAQVYGVTSYGANGVDVVRNYDTSLGGGLVKVANGTVGVAPQPGDVVSFDNGGAGHTGVIASSAVDGAGNGTVTMLSQNDTADGWRTLSVVGWRLQGFASYQPYGWLHDPAGRGGSGYVQLPDVPGRFHPTSPVRILDTRFGVGATGPLTAGLPVDLQVAGTHGVPSTASAVVVNLTAVDASQPGWLTAWPTGRPDPGTSNVNYVTAAARPNLVEVKVGSGGRVRIGNGPAGTTQVVADLLGWYDDGTDPAGAAFQGVAPRRLLDTREGLGTSGPLDPDASVALPVRDGATVPTDATAVVLNLTATDAAAPGWLTVWPDGSSPPLASNVNYPAVDARPNLVIAAIGPDGAVRIGNGPGGPVQVVADLVGWYGPSAGSAEFHPITPVRVVDTRFGVGTTAGPLVAGSPLHVTLAGTAGIPAGATGVVLNLTGTEPSGDTYLTAWPGGAPQPWTSNLNLAAGETAANVVQLGLGPRGGIDLADASGSTHVVIDVMGWFG